MSTIFIWSTAKKGKQISFSEWGVASCVETQAGSICRAIDKLFVRMLPMVKGERHRHNIWSRCKALICHLGRVILRPSGHMNMSLSVRWWWVVEVRIKRMLSPNKIYKILGHKRFEFRKEMLQGQCIYYTMPFR